MYLHKRVFFLFTLLVLAIVSSAPRATAAPFPTPYLNGFENTDDVGSGNNDAMSVVTRVSSTTNGVTSAAGDYHAIAPLITGGSPQAFTRLGGNQSTFPANGYTVSIDIYLDTAISDTGEDSRMSWTSAINDSTGGHRRDFVFSIGTNGTGGYVMSVSNNAPGWPADPGRDPFHITTTGWYTFKHSFRNNSGVLAVDMSVLDSNGTVLKQWAPLSNPADTIATTGGHRYGWLYSNQFENLPIDNITRSGTCTSVCYVDAVNGDDANDGISPATAKKTIQAAINTVDSGGEVRVLPGTYSESPNVNKSLTLVSTDGRDATTIELQTGPNYLGALTIGGDEVTVDGFTIEGRDADCINTFGTLATSNILIGSTPDNVVIQNNRIQVGQVNLGDEAPCSNGDDGIGLITAYNDASDVPSVLVENNIFEPLGANGGRRAFYVNPGVDSFIFRGNTITGNFTSSSLLQAKNGLVEGNTITGTGASGGLGTWGYPEPSEGYGNTTFIDNEISSVANAISIFDTENVTITHNILDGNTRGVRINPANLAFDASTIRINRNSITNNSTAGVANDSASGTVDATCNWWGADDGPGPVGPGTGDGVTADVAFDPFLTSNDLDSVCAGEYYVSADKAGSVAGVPAYHPHDILAYNGTSWSLFFDGAAAGLVNKHDINAVHINAADDLYLSFFQNKIKTVDIGQVFGHDILHYDGSEFSLYFDGSDVGLTTTAEKIDALHILDGDISLPGAGSCDAYLLISTLGTGKVPAAGGGQLSFQGGDILGFCLTNSGETTAGFWHMVVDASVEGMPKNSTDSISASADGQTIYLTTRGAFNVDSASGSHSMVYVYDVPTDEFSGPIFSAPDAGLTEQVDALDIALVD